MKRIEIIDLTDENEPKKIKTEKSEHYIIDDDWTSPTQLRNFFNKDCIIDYLNMYGTNVAEKIPKVRKIYGDTLRKNDSFLNYILQAGKDFETGVITYLSNKFPAGTIVEVAGDLSARDPEKARETFEHLQKGVPIIHSGVLHNPINKTFGVADLIVRDDYLEKILEFPYNFDLPKEKGNLGHGHYYVIIDIKFTTLQLTADGIHIVNSGSLPAYKAQLYIYNEALSLLQGYRPHQAYLIGRKYKYTKCGVNYKGDNCLEKLGVVDFVGKDVEIIKDVDAGLKWFKDLREHGSEWNFDTLPLPHPYLYPNMNNSLMDYPWHPIKEIIAEKIGEITLMWMCGVKQRETAHANGVYSLYDLKCNALSLGFNLPMTKQKDPNKSTMVNTVDQFIKINRLGYAKSQSKELPNVTPQIITHYFPSANDYMEFFVDFEFINDIFTDFSKLPKIETESLIFMFGVGYIDPVYGIWMYHDFTADKLNRVSEYVSGLTFEEFIYGVAKNNNKKPLLYHWGSAEPSQWNSFIKKKGIEDEKILELQKKNIPKHIIVEPWIQQLLDTETHFITDDPNTNLYNNTLDNDDPMWRDEFVWFDLNKLFREEPIIIKGNIHGFGLKPTAKALRKLGLITADYNKQSKCSDGTMAMMMAHNVNKIVEAQPVMFKKLSDHPTMKEIIKYNETDCKLLWEIVKYLRLNHLPKEKDKCLNIE